MLALWHWEALQVEVGCTALDGVKPSRESTSWFTCEEQQVTGPAKLGFKMHCILLGIFDWVGPGEHGRESRNECQTGYQYHLQDMLQALSFNGKGHAITVLTNAM